MAAKKKAKTKKASYDDLTPRSNLPSSSIYGYKSSSSGPKKRYARGKVKR
jgi:hypothetical protein